MRVSLSVIVSCLICYISSSGDNSFSYQKFRGPVSGQIKEVVVPRHGKNEDVTVDFVAKPDYLYSYGVEDPVNGNSQAHKEIRNGDAVTGQYKILQADGFLRIVTYKADPENGFIADVEYFKM